MSRVILAFILPLLVAIATGQEPPLPVATSTPAASPSASARPELNIPDIPVEPAPLVPNTAPTPKKNLPSLQELDTAFQHSSLGATVEEQRLHLEWRKLKNRVSDDPEVIAAKKEIDHARTDLEKRERMRNYYKVFYAHMLPLAETPEVKAYVEQRKKDAINGLAQPRVHPEPTPRPGASP